MCIIDINIPIQLKYRDRCDCFWCFTIVHVTELKLDPNERTAVQFKIERAYCPAYCLLPPLYHNSEIRAVAFVCCGLKWKGIFNGLSTWYQIRNDFNSGKSSFHLHILLCICSHDTETTFRYRTNCSGMSSFQFSFRMKFSFWCEISFWYHVNSTRTSFRIVNRKSCSYIWSEWRMIWRENHASENVYRSLSILPCECRTNFTLEQNLFRNESHSGIIYMKSPLQKLQV